MGGERCSRLSPFIYLSSIASKAFVVLWIQKSKILFSKRKEEWIIRWAKTFWSETLTVGQRKSTTNYLAGTHARDCSRAWEKFKPNNGIVQATTLVNELCSKACEVWLWSTAWPELALDKHAFSWCYSMSRVSYTGKAISEWTITMMK